MSSPGVVHASAKKGEKRGLSQGSFGAHPDLVSLETRQGIRLMKLSKLSVITRRAFSKVKDAIVQDCPPELYECEICGKLDCNSEEWLKCERRLATLRLMTSRSIASDCSYLEDPEKQDVPEEDR